MTQTEEISNEQFPTKEPTVTPTPDTPPWGSPIAFGLWMFSVLLIMLVPVVFLLPYLAWAGVFQQGAERVAEYSITDPGAIVVQMLAIIPAHLLTLAAAWLIVTSNRRYPFFKTLGFQSGGIRWYHYLAALVGFFALAAVVTQFVPDTENQLTRILKSSRTAVLVTAFMATFTAPLVEEVVYRGVLYSAFQRSIGVTGAVAAVTFLFAFVHVFQYYESPATLFLLTVLSLILTLMRTFSGNLLPSFVFHTLINGIQAFGLVAEPYLKNYVEPAANSASHIVK